jgi:ubiquitin C-terminal hydrolase
MSILDRTSARALHDFSVREQERESGKTTSRVLLKVNYDSNGKVYLTAEDEGKWNIFQRIAFFFDHNQYRLERIAKFLCFKSASTAIRKELAAIRILDLKVSKHNAKSITDQVIQSISFEELFTTPIAIPTLGKKDSEAPKALRAVSSPKRVPETTALNTAFGAGMVNSGNSCYMNATLQALRASQKVRSFLLDPKREQHALADATLATFCELEQPGTKPFSFESDSAFREFVVQCAKENKCGWHPSGKTSQEDADEFLNSFLDLINVPNFDFRFKMDYDFPIRIPSLEKSGGRANRISLSIKDNPAGISIQDLISKNVCTELFERDAALNAANFKREHSRAEIKKVENMAEKLDVKTVQEHIFKSAPSFLPITLKRYTHDENGAQKDDKLIKPSDTLEITLENGKKAHYALQAIVLHTGGKSIHSGHYYTYVPKMIDGEKKWVKYNDDRVTVHSEEHVLDDIMKNGYIYLYDRK